MSAPVVIQAAVTGSIGAGTDSPHLPLDSTQIVREAVRAWEAGAAVIHLHAREADGTPTQSVDRFAELVDGIEAAGCDAILNLSTGSAAGRSAGADRFACLALDPEMASFDCGSTNFGDRVFENSPTFLQELAGAFAARRTVPEIECFDASHVVDALRLRDAGLLADPLRFQFVLGVRGGAPATLEQAMYMRSLLPADAIWSACALGRDQLWLNAFCLIAGGHVRTGLEDNLRYARGRYATGNAELVERVVRLATELGREVATPAAARALLALPPDRRTVV
jgi:3-keto-5-aminohexanoate cleavage enzyme